MCCPYLCPLNIKQTIVEHFKEAHPHHLIKNNCFSFLTTSIFDYQQFFLNECEDEIFLSKCRTVGEKKIAFSTICLSSRNLLEYALEFYPELHENPTFTRMLQTKRPENIFQDNHDDVLDLEYISKKVSYPKVLKCSFMFKKKIEG